MQVLSPMGQSMCSRTHACTHFEGGNPTAQEYIPVLSPIGGNPSAPEHMPILTLMGNP